MLFDTTNGRLLALIDATEVTAIRTAAVSGVATRLLARDDAGDLAILGAGTQARKHLEAMLEARNVARVRVWNRSAKRAAEFAARESERHRVRIETATSAQEAVDGADLICTTTSSTEPILEGKWISPGAHINAVGACIPTARELDSEAVAMARLFVDRRESTVSEAGDFIIPKTEGRIDHNHIRGEIGELLLGRVPGRTSPAEITVFKSLGLAAEDVAAAHLIYLKTTEAGTGTWVEMNAKRSA
jgi:ornithine cyclodeaminase